MNVKDIFWIIKYKFYKIDNNQWFFTSHNGDYSDNSKALSEAIHLIYPEIRIVWAVKSRNMTTLPSYVKSVTFLSKEHFQERARSKVLIDNVFCENGYYLNKSEPIKNAIKALLLKMLKKRQNCYGLWHGTPIKCMGKDQLGNDDISGFICNNLTLITGNEYTSKIMSHLSFGKMRCSALGLPRNDILFNKNNNIQQLKEKLSLPKGKRIILYAPTFRNDGKNTQDINPKRSGIEQLELLNVESLLSAFSQRFGGNWVFVCRFHYHVSSVIDWNEIKEKYQEKVLCGNISDDMADYLQCTDALLTDYSSAMFDFALTGKPCFLFVPDLEHYQNEERGFYISIDDLPFSSAKSNMELIESVLNFDESRYNSSVESFFKGLGNADDGNACTRVAEYIYNDIYDS